MGRWQFEYYDQVLTQKLKSLVTGAIDRSKLEEGDEDAAPQITFERFVQDLDHGDSFTTTLIEILVTEIAERQNRPTPSDRHLVSERTIKSLQNLASRRPYRDRTRERERSNILRHHFPEFFAQSNGGSTIDWDVIQHNLEDDDDIDIDDLVASSPGALQHSGPVFSMAPESRRRSFHVQTGEVETDEEIPPTDIAAPSEFLHRSPPLLPRPVARHTTLTRQSSIRRGSRSRVSSDTGFSDFAARRRLANRIEHASQEEPNRASGSESAEPSSSSMSLANLLQQSHYREDDRDEREVNFVSSRSHLTRPERTSRRYVTLHTPSEPSTSSAAPAASRLTVSVPRLRRGGVRAPESLPVAGDGYAHSVRISSPPIPGLLANIRDERRRASSSPSIRAGSEPLPRLPLHGILTPSTSGGEGVSGDLLEVVGTTNLPTPRSISPEDSTNTTT